MKNTARILIAGIGGVGGYFGGLLARRYEHDPEVEVLFLARGQHLQTIRQHGLQVQQATGSFVARPGLATDNAGDIGPVDYMLLCTKSYDLEQTMQQLKPCLHAGTVIVPLLNGVDNPGRIRALVAPGVTVAGGCVYIVSAIQEPGVVRNSGNIQKLFLGTDNTLPPALQKLQQLLTDAGIESVCTTNISAVMWEKFHLVGANSTATSYYNNSTGELLAAPEKATFLLALLQEVNRVAIASGIRYDTDMVAATWQKLKSLPFETTSSMQRDFNKDPNRTELETITGYVARLGKQLRVPTPVFDKAYARLTSL